MPLWGLHQQQRASIMLRMSEIARKPPVPPAERKPVDWEAVEVHYRCGVRSLKNIGEEFGVSDAGIIKRAKRDGWVRDLNAKIQAAAEQKVSAALVSAEVSDGKKVSERFAVEVNSAALAAIRLGHRGAISRSQRIINAQMEELEASSGPEQAQMLRDLGEIMREPDESGRDKLNDLYRAVVSLPERSKIAKQLAETLRITVDMERREFGMDKTAATDDPIAAMLKRINSAAGSSFKPVAQDPAYLGDDE